jgi:hypothetical protein
VLDGNDENPKPWNGYVRYIGSEQKKWLINDLKNNSKPCILFSHQSLEAPRNLYARKQPAAHPDFIKLDNFTVARNFTFNEGSPIESVQVSLIARNPLVITNYTGTDPDPSLVDRGTASNGDIARGADVLSPGIDRRTNYFSSKSFTLGLSVKF